MTNDFFNSYFILPELLVSVFAVLSVAVFVIKNRSVGKKEKKREKKKKEKKEEKSKNL